MLIFRQLFDPVSSTYTYLLGDAASGEAVLIDPVYEHERRDRALLRELGLHLVATLDTHVHADHYSGGPELARRVGASYGLHESNQGRVVFEFAKPSSVVVTTTLATQADTEAVTHA